jgi:hypothetical protein
VTRLVGLVDDGNSFRLRECCRASATLANAFVPWLEWSKTYRLLFACWSALSSLQILWLLFGLVIRVSVCLGTEFLKNDISASLKNPAQFLH